MNALTLRALWQTGRLYPEQVPGFAVGLLAGGADSPALRELAGMDRPMSAEVAPLLERVFSELGVPSHDAGAAWLITAREVAVRAVACTAAPYDAAHSLYGLWSDYGWPPQLAVFLELTDEWEDFPEGRPHPEARILVACEQLLRGLHDAR